MQIYNSLQKQLWRFAETRATADAAPGDEPTRVREFLRTFRVSVCQWMKIKSFTAWPPEFQVSNHALVVIFREMKWNSSSNRINLPARMDGAARPNRYFANRLQFPNQQTRCIFDKIVGLSVWIYQSVTQPVKPCNNCCHWILIKQELYWQNKALAFHRSSLDFNYDCQQQ